MQWSWEGREERLPSSVYQNVPRRLPALESEEVAFERGLEKRTGFPQAEMEGKDFPERGNIHSSQPSLCMCSCYIGSHFVSLSSQFLIRKYLPLIYPKLDCHMAEMRCSDQSEIDIGHFPIGFLRFQICKRLSLGALNSDVNHCLRLVIYLVSGKFLQVVVYGPPASEWTLGPV